MSENNLTDATPVEENSNFAKELGKTFANNTVATAGVMAGIVLVSKAGQLFRSRKARKTENASETTPTAE